MQDIQAQGPFTISIDPVALLRAYQDVGWDTDGAGTTSGPLVLAVIDRVAEKIRGDIRDAVVKEAVASTAAQVRDQVNRIVAETLRAEVTETDAFGSRKSSPKPLSKVIAEQVQTWNAKTDYGRGPSVISKFVAQEVDQTMKAALREMVAQERAKVVERVRAIAAEQIAKEVTR